MAAPGVTEDGSMMLLDAAKSRLNVVSLETGGTVKALEGAASGDRFATFALPSPPQGTGKDRLVITAGAADGVLQMWRMPVGGAIEESVKLKCTTGSPATVAAFGEANDGGFVAVGTKAGQVLFWPLPSEKDLNERLTAKIRYVGKTKDTSGRTYPIQAEVDNRAGKLRPGTTVTLVIPVAPAAGPAAPPKK